MAAQVQEYDSVGDYLDNARRADMKVRMDHEGDSWLYDPDPLLSCAPGDRVSPNYRHRPACW